MRFIVIADSHIRFPDDDVKTYPSNASMLDRNRRVVDMVNSLDAEFVVHLGDIVHPLPVEPGHVPAVELAGEVFAGLRAPIHYVPGNHDIGDKPDAMVAVPPVADENYGIFEEHWGPPFLSFDIGDCHFALVDTPVLNSGLARERAQAEWLENDLRHAAGKRIFMFTHYPPFVRDVAEDEHYDNLGEPARGWLLDLIRDYKVEAVFSGHVHNFLYNHHGGTDYYVLPSTAFFRSDYSELAAVAPEREWGRDDPAKLGFFVVDVDAGGHTVKPVRTHGLGPSVASQGAWQSPIGVTLRHGWMTETDFPTAGLDEFRRKTIRNDATLLALWEARIRRARIPVGDLAAPARVARVGHLAGRGMRFSVRSAGIPVAATHARIAGCAESVERWEIALWPAQYGRALLQAADSPVPVAVAPIAPIGRGQVHHFVTAGFSPADESAVAELVERDQQRTVAELIFRIPFEDDVDAALEACLATAERFEREAVVIVDLPREGESVRFDDDAAVVDLVERVAAAAQKHPGLPIYLDGFMDHDRSYYPRNGLIDRRFNPRPALERLIEVASSEGPVA
jgi:predicted phosphodiesterase